MPRERRRSASRELTFDVDEGPRRDTSRRGAGEAAAGVSRERHRDRRQLVADERRRRGRDRDVGGAARASAGCTPLARFVAFATAGVEPERFGIGPVPAIQQGAEARRPDARSDRPDRAERSFAAQVLACLRELPIDPERLNVNGGAIALGHPLGCTGAKLTTTLLHEMQRRGSALRPGDHVRRRRHGRRRNLRANVMTDCLMTGRAADR